MSHFSHFLRDAEAMLRDVRPGTAGLLDLVASPAITDALVRLGPAGSGTAVTGASDLPRADAFTYGALAAMPRLAEVLGPEVAGVIVEDEAFLLVARYEDPASGLAAVQLRSTTEDRAVFAVDGSALGSIADTVTNLDLGRPQVASPAFAEMVADAREATLLEGLAVAFTGASLGGAIAQAAGYETAEATAAEPGHPGRITVFTVDALGGRDAAESLNDGRLDPAVLDEMNALNIRTEGDIVSRLGGQIGDTVTFQAVNREGEPVTLPPRDAHVNIESLFTTLGSDALYEAGTRGAPREIGLAAAVANQVGPLLAQVYDGFRGLGIVHDEPEPPRLPGISGLDPTGRFFDVDANADGEVDLRVFFAGTSPTEADLLG